MRRRRSRGPTALEVPSVMALWRDSARGLGLFGAKCIKRGTPQYPAQRVCISCKTKDQFEKYRFYDKKARIFTFSHDSLAASVNPPTTVAVVDFEGGGRIICDATDRDPEEIKVDMPIEMTFRELRFAGGIHDYGWKCRPQGRPVVRRRKCDMEGIKDKVAIIGMGCTKFGERGMRT